MADRYDDDPRYVRNDRGRRNRPEDEARAYWRQRREGPRYADDNNPLRWSEDMDNPRFSRSYGVYPEFGDDRDDFAEFPGWHGRSYRPAYGPGGQPSGYDPVRHHYVGRAPGYQSYSDRDLYDWADAGHRGKGPKSYLRPDARIEENVNDRLTDHPRLDATDIEVSVKDSEVTLSGYVSDRREKRIAEDCAEGVTGVRHVQNNLRVTLPTRSGD